MKKSPDVVTHAAKLRYWPGMTDFKVWGSTCVMLVVVVGCGETSNFVGNGPDDGGTGGTAQTSGGTATGGSTSKAGATSSAGKNAGGGSDAGGTGSGGSTSIGGSGGAIDVGGAGMGGGDPTGPGCSKLSGNWLSCDNGLVHRTEPGKCESKLPRAAAIAATKPDMDECTKDSECTAKPNGFCDVLQGGFVPVQPHNICAYGCLQDSDCSDGTVCLCGDLIGQCASAPGCKSDKDCMSGALCTEYDSCPGVPVSSFACQSPNDKCDTDADCAGTSQQFCTVENDGHRDCVGVRCAAVAGAQ